MKRVKSPESFTPIDIIFTIESEQELKALKAMSLLDASIPRVVEKHSGEYVKNFLLKLRKEL